jgi:hypothetical protein
MKNMGSAKTWTRADRIEIISSTSNFEIKELEAMSDVELEKLYHSLETDEWLEELRGEWLDEWREEEENRKSYSIACFTSENYIFVGTVESYILNGKSVDEDLYENLEILEYSKENRFVRFSGDNQSFSLCKEEDVDKKNLISLDRPEGEYGWNSGDIFFEVKPETCILRNNWEEFKVCVGRENVLYIMNRIM